MDVALWIVAGLLAAVYAGLGLGKILQARERLLADPRMAWVEDFSDPVVKTIGALEVAGAVGLILPQATGVAPALTPLAATGLVLLQIGAMATHLRRGERQPLPINITLLVLAAFVAFGRFAGWG